MTRQENYWKLGLLIVGGLALAIGALVWLGVNRLQREFVTYYTYFDEPVEGLEEGSPVKFRGVRIGAVVRIRAASNQKHVEVASHIYGDALEDLGLRNPETDAPLGEGATVSEQMDSLRVQIVRNPITGIAYLQSDFFDPAVYKSEPLPFEPKTPMVETISSTWKALGDALGQAIQTAPKILDKVDRVLDKVDARVEALDVAGLSGDARATLQAAGATFAELQPLIRTARRRLTTMEDLPVMTRAVAALNEIQTTAKEFRGLGEDLRRRDGELQRGLAGFDEMMALLIEELGKSEVAETFSRIRTMGTSVSSMTGDIRGLAQRAGDEVDTLHDTLQAVRRFAETLERDPSSILYGRTATPVRKKR